VAGTDVWTWSRRPVQVTSRARADAARARLWEAQAFYQRDLAEITALFDSVYVSFYKGLGAVTGAMLLGPTAFITEARVWLRRFGGNVFTAFPLALSCATQFRVFMAGPDDRTFFRRADKLRRVVALLQVWDHRVYILGCGCPVHLEVVVVMQAELGEESAAGQFLFTPPAPHVCLVHAYIRGDADRIVRARDEVQRATGVRVFRVLRGTAMGPGKDLCYFEWVSAAPVFFGGGRRGGRWGFGWIGKGSDHSPLRWV
jgi:hypothetical protein